MPMVPAMPTGPPDLGDRIASAVVRKFDSLKPRGKPQGREWSVLAGIVAQDARVIGTVVVSMLIVMILSYTTYCCRIAGT